VRLHFEKGLDCPEIARRLGRSASTIFVGLRKRCVYRRRQALYHGLKWGKRLLATWYRMHVRCSKPTHREFRYFGARGIRVARVWRSFAPFHAWAISAGYRPGLCLTRIDRRRSFSPENCAWAPLVETIHRARYPPREVKPRWTVTAFGESKGPTAWAKDRRCAVSLTALCLRLRSGMPPEEAITLPRRRPAGERWLRLVSAFGEIKSLAQWREVGKRLSSRRSRRSRATR
jgi:hypothetical protein